LAVVSSGSSETALAAKFKGKEKFGKQKMATNLQQQTNLVKKLSVLLWENRFYSKVCRKWLQGE
jgi:hypothetical protein